MTLWERRRQLFDIIERFYFYLDMKLNYVTHNIRTLLDIFYSLSYWHTISEHSFNRLIIDQYVFLTYRTYTHKNRYSVIILSCMIRDETCCFFTGSVP